MKIALACDHAALDMKNDLLEFLKKLGMETCDFGTYESESCDYPIFAARAAKAVVSGDCDRGIVLCGTGIGVSIAANKVPGIRCAHCSEPFSAELTRRHNDANMLAIGARVIGPELARAIAQTFLETAYEGGRHQRRLDLLTALENGEQLG